MAIVKRHTRRKQELRRLILEAAREVFVRDGYAGFSMRKLAARLGYTPGAVYVHFKNQQELFTHLLQESFAVLHRSLVESTQSREQDPRGALVRGLHVYVEFGLAHPDDYRLAFMVIRPDPKGRYLVYPPFDVMRAAVGRCVETGVFRPVDVEATSQALWAAIHGITSLLIQRPNFPWTDRQALIAQVIDNAVGTLLAD